MRPQTPSHPLLDEELFGEVCSVLFSGPGGGDELAGYVSLFLDSTEAALARLAPALAAADAATLRTVVHQVKGTTATTGATRVARRCAEVEEVLRGGDVETARLAPTLTRLVDDFGDTAAALRGRVARLQRGDGGIQPEK